MGSIEASWLESKLASYVLHCQKYMVAAANMFDTTLPVQLLRYTALPVPCCMQAEASGFKSHCPPVGSAMSPISDRRSDP